VEHRRQSRLGLAALAIGATGIAFAPIWVRLSGVGPSATAFHRLFLALPVLWAWYGLERRRSPETPRPARSSDFALLAASGFFFAGDLVVWHWAIKLTSVTNATLFPNLAPIFVTLAARFLFHEAVTRLFVLGMSIALAGALLVAGNSLIQHGHGLAGDALGMLTAVFYGSYQLSVNRLRTRFSTAVIMSWSGLATCPLLLAAAIVSGEKLTPPTVTGWCVLAALALTSQVAGQGLIAYASAHLSASFLSVGLLLQPPLAAGLALVCLGEPISTTQIIGGIVVLTGIGLAHQAAKPAMGSR